MIISVLGASNVGCAILRQESFSNDELVELSDLIDPSTDSEYDYYPLCKVGERFPINDPNLAPRLDPKPLTATHTVDRKNYLHGILQGFYRIDESKETRINLLISRVWLGIARVEADGYKCLQDLGATALTQVYTAGGGSKNDMWTSLRQRLLGVPTKLVSSHLIHSYDCLIPSFITE